MPIRVLVPIVFQGPPGGGTAPLFTADTPPSSVLINTPFSYQFRATGKPVPSYQLASGTLPPGLALSVGGLLSGTPTTAGVYAFAVQAVNTVMPNAVSPTITMTIGSVQSSSTLWGSSTGSGGVSATVSALAPKILRMYENQGAPTPANWAASTGAGAPSSVNVVHSIKPDVPTLAAATSAADPLVQALIGAHSGRPDKPGEWEIMWHEPFNKGFTGAQWAQASINYYRFVMPGVNRNRTNPVKYAICLQGSTINAGVWSQFFTAAAMAACDSVGFDCYKVDQVVNGAAIAANAGKVFSIAETGDLTGVSHTDAQISAFMGSKTSSGTLLYAIQQVVTANALAFVCWYNAGTNSIVGNGFTASVATWKAASA